MVSGATVGVEDSIVSPHALKLGYIHALNIFIHSAQKRRPHFGVGSLETLYLRIIGLLTFVFLLGLHRQRRNHFRTLSKFQQQQKIPMIKTQLGF